MNIHANIRENHDVIRIVLRNTSKLLKKRAYCFTCGQYIFSYYDELSIIIDGNSEPQARQVDIECLRCKVIYQIC